MNLLQLEAQEIRKGDTISWCGRSVTVLAVEADGRRSNTRPGRRFKVFVDRQTLRLHYFDGEVVALAEGEKK